MTTAEFLKYDKMIEFGIATEEELNLVRSLESGSWDEVLDAVCYVRTGYKTFEQYFECEVDTDD